MTNGLILLGFIAIVLTVVLAKVRRRLGMKVTGSVLAAAVCGFAIVILILWATQR